MEIIDKDIYICKIDISTKELVHRRSLKFNCISYLKTLLILTLFFGGRIAFPIFILISWLIGIK